MYLQKNLHPKIFPTFLGVEGREGGGTSPKSNLPSENLHSNFFFISGRRREGGQGRYITQVKSGEGGRGTSPKSNLPSEKFTSQNFSPVSRGGRVVVHRRL